jgi:hypothetical protein
MVIFPHLRFAPEVVQVTFPVTVPPAKGSLVLSLALPFANK